MDISVIGMLRTGDSCLPRSVLWLLRVLHVRVQLLLLPLLTMMLFLPPVYCAVLWLFILLLLPVLRMWLRVRVLLLRRNVLLGVSVRCGMLRHLRVMLRILRSVAAVVWVIRVVHSGERWAGSTGGHATKVCCIPSWHTLG